MRSLLWRKALWGAACNVVGTAADRTQARQPAVEEDGMREGRPKRIIEALTTHAP
jgi:hypothetical protein